MTHLVKNCPFDHPDKIWADYQHKNQHNCGWYQSEQQFSAIFQQDTDFHFDSRFDWPRLESPVQSTEGRCNGLIDHFAVHADGTVSPCCLDDQKIIQLGNIFDNDIKTILESDRATKIKNGFKNGKLIEELCQKCTYINRFKK